LLLGYQEATSVRIGRALRDFLADLAQGNPVAVGIAAFFVLLVAIVATIWIIDLRKRKKDNKGKKTRR
jgi:hypothetical protein